MSRVGCSYDERHNIKHWVMITNLTRRKGGCKAILQSYIYTLLGSSGSGISSSTLSSHEIRATENTLANVCPDRVYLCAHVRGSVYPYTRCPKLNLHRSSERGIIPTPTVYGSIRVAIQLPPSNQPLSLLLLYSNCFLLRSI